MLVLTLGQSVTGAARAEAATGYVPIAGAGSTWSENALDQWIRDVQPLGMRVSYAGTGSTDGRDEFINGTVDFAASDIPFQTDPTDGSAPEDPTAGSYAYMPITAGGTAFMYNLEIDGQRVTNLRLSGENITKIFTGVITNWDSPLIAADNPGLKLPNLPVVPVVRSDGAGDTFELTQWMISQSPSLWNAYCQAAGRAPACGPTSFYPTITGMIGQSGDLGVAGYVSQSYADGAIGYVNYSYALNAGFPVALMLNSAGYYTEPTPQNVAVSLEAAQVDTWDVNNPALYLTEQLQGVYTDADPRTYPLSSYSYLILPTTVQGQFTQAKGNTLAAFSYYAMCQGQQESAGLGYSPMPMNLVEAAFNQIAKIPGAVVQNINIESCNNPTFASSQGPDANLLAETAPYPPACDKQGSAQCSTGTGGAANVATATNRPSGGETTQSAGSGVAASGSSALGASSEASSCPSSTAGTICATQQSSAPSANAVSIDRDPVETPYTLAAAHDWLTTATSVGVLLGLLALVLVPGLAVYWARRRGGPGGELP
ncbi:MAG TPA: phosphate ABC transporter substrate-binding protein PstS [Acidimicrobiales bacterium]|nr:phosphate ABC transporter substrate-binding protein PstS [Acidimicrobiales bacterium]